MTPIETVITSSGLCLPKRLGACAARGGCAPSVGGVPQPAATLPGHKPFSEQVRLPEGEYVLGVGEIRIAVRVTPLGTSTRSVPR